MVDLGQKKVELSTFFYAQKKLPFKRQLWTQSKTYAWFNYLCCAYLLDTSSQLITLKKASM